jgi:hypothetical protein
VAAAAWPGIRYAARVEEGGGTADWRALNRANWDDRVPVHLASSFYDLGAFRAGADSLRPFEPAEAGDVTGKRLIHLQCHIGLDTISWARRGALWGAPRLPDSPSIRMDVWKGEVIASTEEELLTRIQG